MARFSRSATGLEDGAGLGRAKATVLLGPKARTIAVLSLDRITVASKKADLGQYAKWEGDENVSIGTPLKRKVVMEKGLLFWTVVPLLDRCLGFGGAQQKNRV